MSEKMTALANAVSAHDKLVSRLAEHRKLEQEVSDYEAACSKAEADEPDALNDHSLSEDEAVKRISEAQIRKNVHASRIAKKREEVKGSLAKLEAVLTKSEGELRVQYVSLFE
jgi:chromosome segregation ATPase